MNNLQAIDYLIIALFFIISLAIGLYYRQKASKNISGYFLGGRSLPWYIAGLSMVATTFAADTPLAVTELVNKNGISGNWLWWNFLIGGMLTTFFFARLWRRAGILTEIEFIKLRYGDTKPARFLRLFKALYLGLFVNTLILAWVNLALITILQVFFNIDSKEIFWYVIGAMIIAAFYSSLSGLMGVATTDAVQFIIAITGSILLAIYVIDSPQVGGISWLMAKLPSGSINFLPSFGNSSNAGVTMTIGIGAILAYLGLQWWASWYPGAEPGGGGYIAQRMMSTKSEKDSFLATLFFQIFHYIVRPWPWILVGLATIVLYPNLPEGQERLGYIMTIKDFLPVGIKGLLITSIFAAYLSTVSTHLNWGASYLVNDFVIPVFAPKDNKTQVAISRYVTILIMILGAYATTFVTSISEVWKFLLESGAGLGLVLILRWYWWRINIWSEIAATFSPFVFYFMAKFVLHYEFPQSYFFTVGLTTITWLIVMILTTPCKTSTLQNFIKQVKPEGKWLPVYKKLHQSQPVSTIKYNLINWITAVIGAYALLFAIGKLIFGFYTQAIILTAISIISFSILYVFIKKTTTH
jgi:SSS family solute:Na+ symporter